MGPRALLAAWKRCTRDNVPLLAAGVAFYGFLSIFPALIAAVMLYGLIASPATVADQSARLADALPADAASLISGQLAAVAAGTDSSLGFGLAAAMIAALWSASGGVGNLLTAINMVFGGVESRGFVARKLLSLGLTLAAIVFVLLAIGLVAVAPAVFDAVDVLRS